MKRGRDEIAILVWKMWEIRIDEATNSEIETLIRLLKEYLEAE